MPITITPASPDNRVGPGIPVFLQSDFVGPLPADSFWLLIFHLNIEPESNSIGQVQRTAIGPLQLIVPGTVGVPITGHGGNEAVANGTTIRLTAELHSPTAVIDTGTNTTVVWDGSTLLVESVQSFAGGTGTGGLTPAQAVQLQNADLASQLGLPIQQIGAFLAGVASAIVTPPYFFICVEPPVTNLSGTGTLVVPPLPAPNIFVGMTWQWHDIPPGAGRLNGFVTTFTGRPLQLVARYQLNHDVGPVISGEITEWNVDDVLWIWRDKFPSGIGYSVQPGFSVDISFVRTCVTT